MDQLNLFSEHGGDGVDAAHREMIISGLTLSPLRSKTSLQGSKETSLETHLFFACSRAVNSFALFVLPEASLLSYPIIHISALSQETEGPAVHSIHPGAHTYPTIKMLSASFTFTS